MSLFFNHFYSDFESLSVLEFLTQLEVLCDGEESSVLCNSYTELGIFEFVLQMEHYFFGCFMIARNINA
jgi:hypothetical protein